MKKFSVLLLGSTLVFLFLLIAFTTYAAPPEETVAQYDEFESDGDADGVPKADDACHDTLPGEAVNEQGCSVGDQCRCDYPWKNHGEYVSCVTKTSKEFVKAGLITNKERSDYVSEAAKGCDIGSLPNYSNYGDPHSPPIQHANDTFEITFAVTGDPQFWDMYVQPPVPDYCSEFPKDRLLASQKTVEKIHEACQSADPECMGVFVAGDLTQTSSVQPIIAFRQLFEYGYPGDDGGSIACYADDYYHRYSWGYNVGYPMFTLIGNHDDPTRDDHTEYVQDYVNDLKGGPALYKFPIEKRVSGTAPSSFYKGNYAWEWGSFNFISLGLWAFDGGHTNPPDSGKIDWLKEYLASVGHERAIVLFQHYGWDHFSFNRWWSHDDADLLVNVLCNRDSSDQPCGTPTKPRYNVIGIFSGHTHKAEHRYVCAEYDASGTCVVYFDNYIVNDAGPGSGTLDENGYCPPGGDCSTGYTMVHLNVWPEGYDRHTDNQVTVTNYDLTNFRFDYEYSGSGDGKNLTAVDLVPQNPITRTGITSGLTTWDQGEPNGGRLENCATFKPNGRFNDLDCRTHLRFVCREIDLDNPPVKPLHLLIEEDATGTWTDGEFLCMQEGAANGKQWTFSLPKSFEEQVDLMQLVIDSGDPSPVWLNYSDQIGENHWIVYPMDYFYFEPGQPNDGSQLHTYKGSGEDCAVINKNGKLEDRRCENEMHTYVCKDHDGWYIQPEKGMWKQAFDDDKCGEGGFVFPADPHEYQKMVNDLSKDPEWLGSAWISHNDIIEEEDWVSVNWKNRCWGNNFSDIPSEKFRQISNGEDFSCGIGLDWTVNCWGNDQYNQVSHTPSGEFSQLTSGTYFTCGIQVKDGTVICWGDDAAKQVTDTPLSDKFSQISAGGAHVCGVRIDGTLTCWGNNRSKQVDPVPSGEFSQVSAGWPFTCGIRDELSPTQFEGYWNLDDGSGTTAADFSDNQYDGTLERSPTWSSDTAPTNFDSSHSLSFDRADGDYVTIPGTTKIDNLSQLTLSTWVNLTSTPSISGTTSYMRFITLGNEKAVLRYVDHDGTGMLQFYMKTEDESFHSIVVDAPWGTDIWYHVAGTYDGSTMRLYLNGVEQGKREVSGAVETGNGVVLSWSGVGATLDGLLDDVRVTDRALRFSEIQTLAAGGLGSGKVACWGDTIGTTPSDTFTKVVSGEDHTCGVREDSTLACWGSNSVRQLDAPSGTFSQIGAGNNHTCGVRMLTATHSSGYWKMDDGSGTIVVDSSASGYDGTLGNSPTWSSDTAPTNFDNSNSLSFDRADHDYVTIPGTDNINSLSQLSLSTWVKLNSTPHNTYMRFITLGNEKAVLRYVYNTGSYLSFYMNIEESLQGITVDVPWETGVWYHVAGTYDGISMRLYLNGVEQGRKEVSGTVATGDGVLLSHEGLESLDGLMDEVKIYDWAFSSSDIEALAAGGQNGNHGKLVCWGSNSNQQLVAPSGVWDQVSAGGSTSCAIETFIHPWEDDFYGGQKYNEAEDCAKLSTYKEEVEINDVVVEKQTGKFFDNSCDAQLYHFACKSVYRGDWKLTEYWHAPWKYGFQACSEEFTSDEYRFDAPITEADTERLIAQIWKQFGKNMDVWVNYSDARDEGLWRHEFWQNSYWDIPPDGDCAFNSFTGPWRGTTADCSDVKGIICLIGDGGLAQPMGTGTWLEGQQICSNIFGDIGGVMLSPINPARNSGGIFDQWWIRFTDLDYDGRWEDWHYGD